MIILLVLALMIELVVQTYLDMTKDIEIYTYFKKHKNISEKKFKKFLIRNELNDFEDNGESIKVGSVEYKVVDGKIVVPEKFNTDVIDCYKLKKDSGITDKYNEGALYYNNIYIVSDTCYKIVKFSLMRVIRNLILITLNVYILSFISYYIEKKKEPM